MRAISEILTNYDGEYLVKLSDGELWASGLEDAKAELLERGGTELLEEFFEHPLDRILTYSLRC